MEPTIIYDFDGQAESRTEWEEARRRERHLIIVPKTETQEEMEMAKIERLMDKMGIAASILLIVVLAACVAAQISIWLGR